MTQVQVLVPETELRQRVAQLAGEVSNELGQLSPPPLLVGVLKGSALFMADLIRSLTIDVSIDFMSISSYGGSQSPSGVVKIVKDLETDITGRDVVIVEDIVDTGLTLNYLRRTLLQRTPRSLRTISLLDKSARRIVPVPLEFRGFDIPDVFVLGYGMDWREKFRNVPQLLAVKDVGHLTRSLGGVLTELFPMRP